MNEKCAAAIANIRERESAAATAFDAAAYAMDCERKHMFAIVREHYPELDGHEFKIKHKTGEIVVMWPI